MKIIVTGGTGFVGGPLLSRLVAAGHEIILLTRNPDSARSRLDRQIRIEPWDGKVAGSWVQHVDGADAVLNLAGENIGGKRWTAVQKERIIGSRVDGTRAIVASIGKAMKKPVALVNASAVGFYGSVEDGDVAEDHPRGNSFLSETVDQWERAAREAEKSGARVVLLRSGVVLGKGGALDRMVLPFKLFAGGPLGSGRQWFPWVHIDDFVGVVLFALNNEKVSGPVNVVVPQAVTMREFSAELGKTLHRPSWAPVPGFVLKIALGEMSEMLLTGQRVVPRVLERQGYAFRFPKLAPALADILR